MIQVAKILLLGADGVGKTSLLYKLKLNENITTIPTIGFNVEEINYKDKKIIIWDLGGGKKVKNYWKYYMENIKCFIYVLNLSDKERFDYYIECFNSMLENYKNIPIIIFGNKFNNKTEFEPEELINKINIPPEISPYILKGNVLTGEGLPELLDYIYNNVDFDEEEKKEEKIGIISEEQNNEEKMEKKEEFKVRMFGLDDAGKTSILYLLKLGEKIITLPTIGFNCETIENENQEKNMTIWDVGGQKKIRTLWLHYLSDSNGLIWVYDISKKETYEESQNELKTLLNNPNTNKDTPLLIIANKSDLNEEGNTVDDFINGIQDCLGNRPYFIKECNINNLNSYKEGLDWLYNNIN